MYMVQEKETKLCEKKFLKTFENLLTNQSIYDIMYVQ